MADSGCLRHKLAFLLLAALIGCSNRRAGSGALEGTQSTGGGDASVSTPDQVNAAIDKALALATESNPQKNIYVQFWKANGRNSNSGYISHPAHVFPQFQSADESSKFSAPFYQALKQIKIDRLKKGDCPHPPEETTASASVSEHSFNAILCFSIGNLTRIPPSSLLQEVSGLLLHEITHMSGAEEPEARAWQNEFVHYFGDRFGNVLTNADYSKTSLMIDKAYRLVGRAQSFAEKNALDHHVMSDMAAAIETIASLPDASDELALELKINPPHPELTEIYVRAVQTFVDSMRSKIEWHQPGNGPVLESYHMPISSVRTAEIPSQDVNIMATLNDLRHGIDEVNESFLAFTQAKPF